MITASLTAAVAANAAWRPAQARGIAGALVVVLSLLATSQLAVALVNWLATLLVTPRSLPRMDFSRRALPASARTLVVVPTMLTSAQRRGAWSRRSRCASWPIAIRTCTSRC